MNILNLLKPPPPVIPWLVQAAPTDKGKLSWKWDTVQAAGSREAAIKYATEHPELVADGWWVYVGPMSPLLRHSNGMPQFVRGFQIKRNEQGSFAA